jgi:ATP-dependent helicase/nuclease subunit A
MTGPTDPQVRASNPRASAFVPANAGSGKTSTLVKRVARLLLAGARPGAILCVTYTKAGAAEMQRRLFDQLGEWSVAPDEVLRQSLQALDEGDRPLSEARRLFARALETPGGLKIQTLHAFCETMLRRFPLEAGVTPGFRVLEGEAAARVSAETRADLALLTLSEPDGLTARAYGWLAGLLDLDSFSQLLARFEADRAVIAAYVQRAESRGGFVHDLWRRFGFDAPSTLELIEAEAMARIRWGVWRRHAEVLAQSPMASDRNLGEKMAALAADSPCEALWAIFVTDGGTPRKTLGTKSIAEATRTWLSEEQLRCVESRRRVFAAALAEASVQAVILARTYGALYDDAKARRGALDFADLTALARSLITERADASWVLYKLDGGLDHILLDEAQDTAADQWSILHALSEEFFSGRGAAAAGRTLFAVGDEKQSIFSFQGAAPERLKIETQAFDRRVNGAGERFETVPLVKSYRTAPEILTLVDAVLQDPDVRRGVSPTAGANVVGLLLAHEAARGPGGGVDLWPVTVRAASPKSQAWISQGDASAPGAERVLADQIALAIRAMVERGEGVRERRGESEVLRPCAYGDVLILVRRRRTLFQEIIRALKRAGVPVAGADRLKLSEHGAFHDLIALAQYVCFPADDLVLAGVLRSPFCDVDEDGLFDLAHQRDGALWAALERRAEEKPAWREAQAFLVWARRQGREASPFDFYQRVLARLDASGRSQRQRLLTRFGAEAEQALDAFLAQALALEADGAPDLETFIAGALAIDVEIKREQGAPTPGAAGEVRVMTVHGAKGLEAPIVILPDTTTRAAPQGRDGWLAAEGDGYFWAPRAKEDVEPSAQARAARLRAHEEESARLLYVALTRARDRLILCGVESRTHLFKNSWYDIVARALEALEARTVPDDPGVRRWGADPVLAPSERPARAPGISRPPWMAAPAPAEPAGMRILSPSRLEAAERTPATSPLSGVGGLGRFRRGELIHTLLQHLPDVAPTERRATASLRLARQRDLSEAQRAEILASTFGVLEDPEFADVFGPGSRPEASICGRAAGLPAGVAVSGRLDRLLVTPERVLAVDFKTNRPAPATIDGVDPAYLRQMALYAAVLAEIFPGRAIAAALIWTDGPRLMPLPQDRLSQALAALAGAQTF